MAISDRIAVFNVGRLDQVGTPKEIYNRPANGAVARFIGDINVLTGSMDQALRKQLPCTPEESFFIRPHKVAISKEAAPGTVSFPAVIDSFEFLGAYTKIIARTEDGARVTALMFGSETDYETGEAVSISFRPEDVLVLKEA